MLKQKKGQITIFIIVGIILLLGAVAFFTIRSQVTKKVQETEVETAIWANSIKNYITDCLTETSIAGFQQIGWHGGFIDMHDPSITG
ncbi:MAG: hypothetical protein KJ922_05725, partial [Nanoarchaeota archaeon]|nr:hypothetical protein [Nanoarchaeota archaeon]